MTDAELAGFPAYGDEPKEPPRTDPIPVDQFPAPPFDPNNTPPTPDDYTEPEAE